MARTNTPTNAVATKGVNCQDMLPSGPPITSSTQEIAATSALIAMAGIFRGCPSVLLTAVLVTLLATALAAVLAAPGELSAGKCVITNIPENT